MMSMTLQPLLVQSLETILRHAGQDLFQTSPAPALPCGSFEGETGDIDGVSGAGTGSGSLTVFLRVSSWSFVCLRG